MMHESLNAEVLNRLFAGRPLDGLPLGDREGRLDLRGLALPDARIKRAFEFSGIPLQEIGPTPFVKNAKWQNYDFTGSKLKHLRLSDCEMTNCCFDRCQLEDLRVWATTFRACRFKAANLKGSALGGVQNGRWNIYSGVDFSTADLRGTAYTAAAFERCIFRNSKLEGIDFGTSTFANCVFEGKLRDVLFYRRDYGGESFPANEMLNVDFSRAELHDVGFRGLTLEHVKLPEDSKHIVLRNVATTLNRLIVALSHEGDTTAKKLIGFLDIDKEWRPPDLVQMSINIQDLAETVGDEGVSRLCKLLERAAKS